MSTCNLFGVEPSRLLCFRDRDNFYPDPDQEDDAESELDPKDKEWIELAKKGYERNHSELDHEDDLDDIQEVRRRTETLSLLNKFVPWKMNGASSDDILALFDHCPNIEHLDVPCVSQVRSELESLMRSIKERCPRIRTLSSKGGRESCHLFCLMETLPHQQLQEVKITNRNYIFSNAVTRRALGRHSTTLRKVDIHSSFGIGSEGVLAILELCGSLEVLITHPDQCEGRNFLALSDAISVPWASKKIRHLEITIGLPEDSQYLYCAPVVPSEEERQQFADLERFYRQIGSLITLEYLDMRAVCTDINGNGTESTEMNTSKCAFPAMLNLPDCATGWPGYLNLLAGWVKLKELRGSVRVTTDETKVTVGVQEIEWIAAHWPSLECVAFFKWDSDVKDQRFMRLRDELRPGLSLWQKDSIRALSRNVQHVRWLMCDQEGIGFLFNCLLAGQGEEEEVAAAETTAGDLAGAVNGADMGASSLSRTTTTTTTPRPGWVPEFETSPSGTVIVPLSPMHCLTYLELTLMPLGSIYWASYRLPASASSARTTLRQTCWIIQQCPNLVALELVHVPVQDSKDMRLLSATIQGVVGWVKDCKLFSSDAMDPGYYWDLTDAGWPAEEMEEVLDIPEIRRREEPSLVNLTKFVAWGMERSITPDEILAVFKHCPNIRTLKVPSVSLGQKELTRLATAIAACCPHIRTLSILDSSDGYLLTRLMEVMPAHTLEKVKLANFKYRLDSTTTRLIFANHARSLRTIDLRHTTDMSSKNMVTILELCEALEEFKKHPDWSSGDDFMTLQDAVSVTWACRRIRHLELTIGIPEVLAPARLEEEEEEEERSLVLSNDEQRLFTKLEKLYTQLGGFIDLEYLDLRAIEYVEPNNNQVQTGSPPTPFDNHSPDDETHNNTFPAMLSLPNTETGKPGYLHLLRGWTKLKELRGSVSVETEETRVTVGDKEVDWFLDHWPMLERVNFFSGLVVSDKFNRLEEARPDLILCH
ncbi:hypothetical protein BGX30_014483 [Mortierella sp. GBA39]|nr:hypothetical protein BGX30_014483 [Mortierella sp. GBA39]